MSLALRLATGLPLVLLVVGAACNRTSPAIPASPLPTRAQTLEAGAQETTACSDSALTSLGGDTLEARHLGTPGSHVSRHGCRLTFRDSTGRPELTLEDVLREGDGWVLHRYRGRIPGLGADLVERSFYEGGAYLLIFPGGAPIGVAGPPLLSPDGTRFVTWQMDLVAEYDPNILQIWRRTPGGARLELAVTSEDWGPSDVEWLDGASLRFRQNFPNEDINDPTQRVATLRLRDGRWVVELRTH